MAQSSTTISSQRDHKVNITGTDISFVASTKTISAVSTALANLAVYDVITVTGTSLNNSTFTVASVATNGLSITLYRVRHEQISGRRILLTGRRRTHSGIPRVGHTNRISQNARIVGHNTH